MKINKITQYLDELFPNAYCELNYSKDYELLIAVMLSAQTTDIRVNSVTKVLFDLYPTLEDLSKANIDDLMGIIRPIGTFRRKAYNIIDISTKLISEQNGVVPNDRAFLESLSGVGRKTANVILSVLFNQPVIAVDTHIKRVSIRLALAKPNDDIRQIEDKVTKLFVKQNLNKLHHQLIFFGRYHCKARGPNCEKCKLIDICIEKNKNI